MPYLTSRRRYSRWDGSQDLADLDPDEVLAALGEDLMHYGDLRTALRNLLRRGFRGQAPMPGIRDLLRQLRTERTQRIERHDLSGVMEGLRRALQEVIDLEREALERQRDGEDPGADAGGAGAQAGPTDGSRGGSAGERGAGKTGEAPPLREGSKTSRRSRPAPPERPARAAPAGDGSESFASSLMRRIAEQWLERLAALPEDPAGQVKALEQHEFTSPEASRKFAELLDQLRQAMTRSFFKDIERMVREMSDGDIERLKRMVDDLNDMLLKRIAGEEPGFEEFMARYGDMFGPNPPRSLDELIEQMQRQMAAMQSLMLSMSTEDYEQLHNLLRDRLGDPELESRLRSLGQKLDFLDPDSARRYRFSGERELDLQAAMRMMEELHDLDRLEDQLEGVSRDGDLDRLDARKLEALLGPEAREALEQMKKLTEVLERAGYLKRDGDRHDLTPRGIRMIGRQALGEVYRALKRDSMGNHRVPEEGRFGERLDATKPHEFGEPFNLHLSRTLRNALRREGLGTPVRLRPEDFEVYRHEQATRTATVMLVDLSWSMELRGAFPAAKKVALALESLITSAFPRDSLHIVGFAAYARELDRKEVPFLSTDDRVLGTNIQHALLIAEQLLARHPGGTRQVLMITDGEPTAHIENGRAQFAYPPTPTTIRETLRAVRRCTSKRITINTFMLDESHYLRSFMQEVSRINGGRVFFSAPERLGEYVLVDYVRNKRKRLSRQ